MNVNKENIGNKKPHVSKCCIGNNILDVNNEQVGNNESNVNKIAFGNKS